MKFAGIQKTSLIDFPNRVASVLFTPGCNLRCPFCHNWRIVIDPKPPFLNEAAVIRILERRKRFIDAVVITGGEPTIHKELPKFIKKLKDKGFAVKLDTNGFNSKILKECLQYVDYVALDVKTSPGKYDRLGAASIEEFLRTVEIVKLGKVKYEFRTTVVPQFVTDEDIAEIGELVRGARNFAFQQFSPHDTLDKTFSTIAPYSTESIARFGEIMQNYAENITLRI